MKFGGDIEPGRATIDLTVSVDRLEFDPKANPLMRLTIMTPHGAYVLEGGLVLVSKPDCGCEP